MKPTAKHILTAGVSALGLTAGIAQADIIHADDVIAQFSMCIGNDCVNGESFGFDTLRLKENNLRLHFQDTSSSASFPSVDWRLVANDSANGGANKFSLQQVDASRTPFTIRSGAASNALYIDDQGDVGLNTSTPALELSIADGDTPSVRLEQTGASGWTPQTWDMAGNETNFFIRDVTHGSALPFKIRPDADSNALVIDVDSDIGIGLLSASEPLHVQRSGTTEATILVDSAGAADSTLLLEQNGTIAATWEFRNAQGSGRLNIGIAGGNTPLKIDDGADSNLLKLGDNTNSDAVIVTGRLLVNGTQMAVPDYVFEDDYKLMPLSEVAAFIDKNGHLPKVPSAGEINASAGLNMVDMQLKLLEKVEELTLYTLAQEDTITAQADAIAALISEIEALKAAN